MEVRRLSPEQDEHLIREAVDWLDSQPLFFRNADAAWGTEDADSYLAQMRDAQADFGVFVEGQMVAVITLSLEGKGTYNVHLMARKGTDPRPIVIAGLRALKELRARGMREAWCWLAARNRGVAMVLEAVGLVRDGVERFKGQSHGQPIRWVRYSVGA